MIKKYYKIQFRLVSPLSVGCGQNRVTDSDIILDNKEQPYIPGTSLAGVYRRIFSDETAERYFGVNLTEERIHESSEKGKNTLTESRIIVYDAHILPKSGYAITKRDMVALDEYKVALPGAKFDFQILEPGAEFVTYIEQNMEDDKEQYVSNEIACAWQQRKIRLGAKTGKGYGKTESVEIFECCFDLKNQGDLSKWLSFDMYEDACWSPCTPFCLSQNENDTERTKLEGIYKNAEIDLREEQFVCIQLGLQQIGGISVRQYTTDSGEADYMQMRRKDGTLIIPGTSWAGAFRAHMGRLNPGFAKDSELSELFFGKKKGKKAEESCKARVSFSESELGRGTEVTYTRNAIDRFTGGAVDGALYKEKTYYNGSTQLDIICDFSGLGKEACENFGKTLAGAILDLHRGFMSVGGLTSIGHGIFRVTEIKVNQKEVVFNKDKGDKDWYGRLWTGIAGEEAKDANS